jgi:hypothetical protein
VRPRALARIGLVLLLVAAGGCATERFRFAALSSQPVPALGYPLEGSRVVPDVASEVRSHTILWIPTNTDAPTLQDAVDGALRRGGGNLLVDVDVEHWWVFVPFLYGQEGWRVRGDVVRSIEPR